MRNFPPHQNKFDWIRFYLKSHTSLQSHPNTAIPPFPPSSSASRLSTASQKNSYKMQIIIESALENGKIPEWGLLEFQGSFLTLENQPIYEEFMGDLNYTKDGVPFFIVGHHILYGEEVKLPRPMAVLNKTTDEFTNSKKYLVKAVIRRKILFKTRPKPIICQQVNKNNG